MPVLTMEAWWLLCAGDGSSPRPSPRERGEEPAELEGKGQEAAVNQLAHLVGALVLTLIGITPIVQIRAQDRSTRLNVWDIHLDDAASAIPDGFINYACGTNGGPPSIPLANFTEFKKCRPEGNGLHEVYFEYDDELEYWARALDIK